MRSTNVYIVGAGFSKHAGLPLQSDFTEALLEPRADKAHPMLPLVKHLATFVHDTFDHSVSAKAKFWPNLEDVFTNIDLAANTGHHLGLAHPPSSLRTTRRVLLARMMFMLHERYAEGKRAATEDWTKLDKFFDNIDVDRSAFISLNWDTVIERRLVAQRNIKRFDYRCEAKAAEFGSKGNVISARPLPKTLGTVPVVKIHGSVNWLYCDNCRQLYWFAADDALAIAMQLITREEGDRLGLTDLAACAKWRCIECRSVPLTTRIATFSFLKALDFPMFEKSWLSAEQLLREADKWVFIGYSLPAADYEFKYLLKRVQLSRKVPPAFVVITGGSEESCEYTYANYQRFLGRGIKRHDNVFTDGLSDDAIEAAK
jgi:hypothetical protein